MTILRASKKEGLFAGFAGGGEMQEEKGYYAVFVDTFVIVVHAYEVAVRNDRLLAGFGSLQEHLAGDGG